MVISQVVHRPVVRGVICGLFVNKLYRLGSIQLQTGGGYTYRLGEDTVTVTYPPQLLTGEDTVTDWGMIHLPIGRGYSYRVGGGYSYRLGGYSHGLGDTVIYWGGYSYGLGEDTVTDWGRIVTKQWSNITSPVNLRTGTVLSLW